MFNLQVLQQPKSYKEGASVSYRVKEFNPLEHEMVGEGTTHDRYNCPFCLERRGKEDDDGKFYFDRTKLIGWCFKCQTVGIIQSDLPISQVQLQSALMALQTSLVPKTVSVGDMPELPFDNMFMPLDQEGVDYGLSRVPVYVEELLDALHLRISPKVGIAFPVRINNKIVSYTLRYYNPPTKMKYFLPNGTKYLYSPNNALCKDNVGMEITIVEGPFSAVGALLDGYVNPIAVFGNTLTPLQIAILRKYSPSKINIYLDDNSLSWTLYHKIKKSFPTCAEFNMVRSYGDDPEEVYLKKFSRIKTEEDFNKLLSNLQSIISDLNDKSHKVQ
ncbi:hypothetical protein [Ralstonia phage RP13]|nr:hypothetical protein [Ralstonia phage RP13]